MIGIILVIGVLIIAFIVYFKTIKSLDNPKSESPQEESKVPKTKALKVSEKRFFIVWIGVCSFALLVNVADIRGGLNPSYSKTISNLWTTNNHEDDFWPFTTFTNDYSFAQPKAGVKNYGYGLTYDQLDTFEGTHFYGIFNSFNGLEFLVYVILGFAIIFILKIW